VPAREYKCKVTEILWLSPTVFTLRFEPFKKIAFEPGQFLSVQLPKRPSDSRAARRIYSFASGGSKDGYELCVQLVPDGRGSSYLASLKPGDAFHINAPFGDFTLETRSTRNACFVATSTGIAPFKSMVLSERFRKDPPAATLLLFGGRTEKEILFPGLFEGQGVEVVHALSQPSNFWNGFKGRVTDFLKSLPENWPWQETDFYLCGNGHMIEQVRQHLSSARNVPGLAIRQEAYFSTHAPLQSLNEVKKKVA
jgi:NAD(P)H-flavin reductase